MGPKKRKRFLDVRKDKNKTKNTGASSSRTLETDDVRRFGKCKQ